VPVSARQAVGGGAGTVRRSRSVMLLFRAELKAARAAGRALGAADAAVGAAGLGRWVACRRRQWGSRLLCGMRILNEDPSYEWLLNGYQTSYSACRIGPLGFGVWI
jgi:hypothetical protein